MASDPIAVLGAGGTLGLAMARNLLGAGIDVHAWNRTAERAAPLADDGAHVAASAAEEPGCDRSRAARSTPATPT